MGMLTYARLKRDRRKFLAMTGLTLKEFKLLLPAFEQAYRKRYERAKSLASRKRKRRIGGGRRAVLQTAEQKLLFILVYQKTYLSIATTSCRVFRPGSNQANSHDIVRGCAEKQARGHGRVP